MTIIRWAARISSLSAGCKKGSSNAAPASTKGASIPIDFDHYASVVLERCDAIAQCTDEPGRITRLFCSPAMAEAHRLIDRWLKAARMDRYVDSAGNLFGTYSPPGSHYDQRVIVGSHLDSVVDAGRYDGVLGVMMGLAAAEALREAGTALPFDIEVVGFSEEEGVRFKAPFIGSLALAGELDEVMLSRVDEDGVSVEEALRRFGVEPPQYPEVGAIEPGEVVAYIEPHIEQGPQLESAGEPLGVVTAIAGQTRMTFAWSGEGGHAGTVPMALRNDPLLAASRWALAVDELGRTTGGLVATVGRMEIDPNAANCIPRRVRASLDVRHSDDEVRCSAVARLVESAERLACELNLALAVETVHENAAIGMNAELTERLASVIAAAGHHPLKLVSGAGHDAGIMAKLVPTAMLFLRSPGGVSHDPDEAVTHGDVAAGLAALVQFIEMLASTGRPRERQRGIA